MRDRSGVAGGAHAIGLVIGEVDAVYPAKTSVVRSSLPTTSRPAPHQDRSRM
jgi:hypothetical protein